MGEEVNVEGWEPAIQSRLQSRLNQPPEGDPGTWSHCGNGVPHAPHIHTIVMNEGPYPGVQCNGTRRPVVATSTPLEPSRTVMRWRMHEVFRDSRVRQYEDENTGITMIFAADEVREWPAHIEITVTEMHN